MIARRLLPFLCPIVLLAGCGSGDSDAYGTPPLTDPTTADTEPPAELAPPTDPAMSATSVSSNSADDAPAAPAASAITSPDSNPSSTSAAVSTSAVAPATTATIEPLTILVTDDDGIGAPGIDALVTALQQLPDVEVIVVAPAANQSGTSDQVSPGPVASRPSATMSGVAGIEVDGFPADSVNIALDEIGVEPDVVVSGANAGQNIGAFVPLSGTVGAARTAARRGIPAIAVSAGGLAGSDFATAARYAADEVAARRDSLGFGANADHTVVNINVPTCAPGTATRGIVDVPVAVTFPADTNGLDLVFDCASTAVDPPDDAVALTIGFASRSIVPADL